VLQFKKKELNNKILELGGELVGLEPMIKWNKKWIWGKLIPGVLFFGIFGGVAIRGLWVQHTLRENHRYTIGTTIKTYWTMANGKQVLYTFNVGGRDYISSDRHHDEYKVPNGRCYIMFYVKDPEISEILQSKTVSDSIKEIPINGWEKIPE
jgi:hypothetical protein